ncbi:MAG TPA: hypothetical protein VMZ91_06050 [Candidatus Paceibacterota bacterium]|nr:hypothetical protein [Candidatus Paceibacterota bacterium]
MFESLYSEEDFSQDFKRIRDIGKKYSGFHMTEFRPISLISFEKIQGKIKGKKIKNLIKISCEYLSDQEIESILDFGTKIDSYKEFDFIFRFIQGMSHNTYIKKYNRDNYKLKRS